MKRFAWILSVLALGAYGCDSGSGGGGGGDDCDSPCTRSNQCAVGEYCEEFCCAPLTLCTPTSCDGTDFCDDDGTCKSLGQKCASTSCECVIANTVGQFPAAGSTVSDPTVIELPAFSKHTFQIALAEEGGSPLPGGGFTLSLDDTTYFTLDTAGTGVEATGTAGGPTVVTATSADDPSVVCYARLQNIDTGSGTRFHVFDDLTGEPISGARVMVDAGTQDGVDDFAGSPLITDADGRVSQTIADTYSVHVFKDGYNYLSVVGLPNTISDVALPLGARQANPNDELVGGFTGRLGFDDYERLFLAGTAKAIKFGIVASSFPLSSILNFDLNLFIGDFNLDVDCDATPSAPGCYAINIPGVVDTVAPLPGGVILGLASTAIKSHFDVIAKHGRRYGWALGGEIEVQDIAPLIDIVTPLLSCDCDDTTDVCDAGCTCDADCPGGGQIDIGQVFNGLVPLFVNFASGAQGNLPLPGVTKSSWNTHITGDYLSGRTPDSNFPKLDSGTSYGKMQLRQGLNTFTNYAVPDLPADPLATGSVTTMEGMLIVTGVNAAGYGFVPLGIGAALDCTVGNCLDPDDTTNPGVFNGKVNGGQMCVYDPDPELNGCPVGVPENTTEGHIGLFSAAPHAGLEGQEQITLALALPLSSISDGPIRVTAFVNRTPPQQGDQTLTGTFPTAPSMNVISGRNYTVDDTSVEHDAHWITFASDENANGSTARWNVFFPAAGGTFMAPAVPSGDDPLDETCCATPTESDGTINVTHVAFRLMSSVSDSFQDFAAHDGTNLGHLVDAIDGFAVTSADVAVE